MDLEGIDDSFSADAAPEVRERPSDVAVLRVGGFEQHGDFLPLVTDTLTADIVAVRISAEHGLMLLSPVTFGCSHEHAQLGATVSIRARTLFPARPDWDAARQAAGLELDATFCWLLRRASPPRAGVGRGGEASPERPRQRASPASWRGRASECNGAI